MKYKPDRYAKYQKYYSPKSLWQKMGKAAKKVGAKAAYAALLLYYASTDKNVPLSDKARIIGALGYFILPLDILPDLTPIFGYSDDIAALLWALKTVWKNITPEIKDKARKKLSEWYGDINEEEIKIM